MSAAQLVTEAQDHYFAGDLDAAVDCCRAALEVDGQDEGALELLTQALYSQGKHAETYEAASLWVKTCGQQPKPLSMLLHAAYLSKQADAVEHAASQVTSFTEYVVPYAGQPFYSLNQLLATTAVVAAEFGLVEVSSNAAQLAQSYVAVDEDVGDDGMGGIPGTDGFLLSDMLDMDMGAHGDALTDEELALMLAAGYQFGSDEAGGMMGSSSSSGGGDVGETEIGDGLDGAQLELNGTGLGGLELASSTAASVGSDHTNRTLDNMTAGEGDEEVLAMVMFSRLMCMVHGGKEGSSSGSEETSSSSSGSSGGGYDNHSSPLMDEEAAEACVEQLQLLALDEGSQATTTATTLVALYLLDRERAEEALQFLSQIQEEGREVAHTVTFATLMAMAMHKALGMELDLPANASTNAQLLVRKRLGDWTDSSNNDTEK